MRIVASVFAGVALFALAGCGRNPELPCETRPSYDKITAAIAGKMTGGDISRVSIVAISSACHERSVYYMTDTTQSAAALVPADNGKWYLVWPGAGYLMVVEVPQ
jgi:hypothetical protein